MLNGRSYTNDFWSLMKINSVLAKLRRLFGKKAKPVPMDRAEWFARREEKRQRSLLEYSYTLRLKKKSKSGFTLPM
jgi:hypothetical protein